MEILSMFTAVIYAMLGLACALKPMLSLDSERISEGSYLFLNLLQQDASYRSKGKFALNGGDEKSRIAVCISGELARLELQSKIENVFKPLAVDHAVHVFLTMEVGDPTFVNEETYFNDTSGFTENAAMKKLGAFYQAGSFSPHAVFEANISRWSQYLNDSKGASLDRTERLASHMSQHSTLRKCVQLIEEAEREHEIKYATVIKMRDDTIAMKRFMLQPLLDMLDFCGDAVVTKDCSSWDGVNDKVMVLPREHLAAALGGTYDVLMGVNAGDPYLLTKVAADPEIINIERLLKRVLELNNVANIPVDADILPFVDARLKAVVDGTEMWCPVDLWKDCRPDEPLQYHIDSSCREGAESAGNRPEAKGSSVLKAKRSSSEGITRRCDDSCFRNTQDPWSTKIFWKACKDCDPPDDCSSRCLSATNPWSEKIKWSDCNGCFTCSRKFSLH